jgi:NADH:ubiquinone oxidoreductase subunit 3 (subunit A)
LIHPYVLAGLFLLVAVLSGAAPALLARVRRPETPSLHEPEILDRGRSPFTDTGIAFKPHYYLFALASVVFTVAVAFLFPWALAYTDLSLHAVAGAAFFLALPGAGLLYVWCRGWLAWK